MLQERRELRKRDAAAAVHVLLTRLLVHVDSVSADGLGKDRDIDELCDALALPELGPWHKNFHRKGVAATRGIDADSKLPKRWKIDHEGDIIFIRRMQSLSHISHCLSIYYAEL